MPRRKCDLDGLVELRRRGLLGERDRLERRVERVVVDLRRGARGTSCRASSLAYLLWSAGRERALPHRARGAASAVRSRA